MKASAPPVALLMAAAALLSGCVTHRFFIDLRSANRIQYVVDGDSVDVFDGLIQLPRKDAWTLTDRQRTEGVDEEPTIRLSYTANPGTTIKHPVGPPENPGRITVHRGRNPLYKNVRVDAEFPSWEVKERYGDPEKYLPDTLLQVLDQPDFDSLSPGKREEYEQRFWEAQVHSARDRYRHMLNDLVLPELESRGRVVDDDAYEQGAIPLEEKMDVLSRACLRAGENASDLDWYDELRMPLAESAMVILGGHTADWLPLADSLERRYKSWLDFSDESVVLELLMPGRVSTTIQPDTLRGDTLVWEFTGDTVSDSTLVLTASSWEPRWPGVILLLLLIQAVATFLLHRRYRRRA